MPGTCGKYRTGAVPEVGVEVMKWQANSGLRSSWWEETEIIHKQTNEHKCRDNDKTEKIWWSGVGGSWHSFLCRGMKDGMRPS